LPAQADDRLCQPILDVGFLVLDRSERPRGISPVRTEADWIVGVR
jgi:hypothetical protein